MKFIGVYFVALAIIGSCLASNRLDLDRVLSKVDVNSLKEAASEASQFYDGFEDAVNDLSREIDVALNDAVPDEAEDLTSPEQMDKMITSLENERELENLAKESNPRNRRYKRLTVDFMGMQVSYPQYLRLVKLQEKVIKLNQMIEALHMRYTQEQLQSLPQYARLMQLHSSLMPLLPPQMREAHGVTDVSRINKRTIYVDFMGKQIPYPSYLKLKAIQEKAIHMDKVMREMLTIYPKEVLEAQPKWQELLSIRESLKKIMPAEYMDQFPDVLTNPSRRKRSPTSVEFNGMLVSYPQYIRLMKLQEKAVKLDTIMRKLADGRDPSQLAENEKWLELLALRQSLQKLLPSDYPEFEMNPTKRGASMDFNGIQVSYPQYLHLMSLQEKALKLDAAMKKISENANPDTLAKNPKWNTLVELRQSLSKLLPVEHENILNKKSSN